MLSKHKPVARFLVGIISTKKIKVTEVAAIIQPRETYVRIFNDKVLLAQEVPTRHRVPSVYGIHCDPNRPPKMPIFFLSIIPKIKIGAMTSAEA